MKIPKTLLTIALVFSSFFPLAASIRTLDFQQKPHIGHFSEFSPDAHPVIVVYLIETQQGTELFWCTMHIDPTDNMVNGFEGGASYSSGMSQDIGSLSTYALVDVWGLKDLEMSIVGKSYILPVSNIGTLHGRRGKNYNTSWLRYTGIYNALDGVLSAGGGEGWETVRDAAISGHPDFATYRLETLAALTSIAPAFNNKLPGDDKKDGEYRLFGQFDIKFCAIGDKIKIDSIKVEEDREGGVEAPFVSGTINTFSEVKNKTTSGFDLEFKIWGRPNKIVEPGMQWVATRTSVNIWQEGKIHISAKNGKVEYSKLKWGYSYFPSHRLWIDGGAHKKDVRQGPLSGLWIPLPGHSTFVNGKRAK